LHPIRLNVIAERGREESVSWLSQNPLLTRLILGSDNPADLGWLLFVTSEN